MTSISLLGLPGALREQSSNRKLLREAARLFGNCIYEEADLNLPLYNGDDEESTGIPKSVQRLANQITHADGIVVSTPEYNKGVSGVLKNALDWISRTEGSPWRDKPVAIMSSAGGRTGGVRAQVMLTACLAPFRPRLVLGPELALDNGPAQFDENGQLLNDRYMKTLSALMHDFRNEIESQGRHPDSTELP